MLQTIWEVGLGFMALNLKHNLMTKFEWETNNQCGECEEGECRFTDALMKRHIILHF